MYKYSSDFNQLLNIYLMMHRYYDIIGFTAYTFSDVLDEVLHFTYSGEDLLYNELSDSSDEEVLSYRNDIVNYLRNINWCKVLYYIEVNDMIEESTISSILKTKSIFNKQLSIVDKEHYNKGYKYINDIIEAYDAKCMYDILFSSLFSIVPIKANDITMIEETSDYIKERFNKKDTCNLLLYLKKMDTYFLRYSNDILNIIVDSKKEFVFSNIREYLKSKDLMISERYQILNMFYELCTIGKLSYIHDFSDLSNVLKLFLNIKESGNKFLLDYPC